MRRVVLSVVAVMALSVGVAAPVGAQEPNPLTINPDSGFPGDLVAAHVDPEVVAENCITDVQDILDLFAFFPTPGPLIDDLFAAFPLIGWDGGSPPETEEQKAAQVLGFTFLGLGGLGPDGSAPAEELLANSFVLTFADVATQQPVGEPHTFDPNSGEGQIVVPELAPGLWAIAATCVEPVITDDSFLAAIAAGIACLEEVYGEDWFDPADPDEPSPIEAAPLCGPAMIAELVQPQEGAGPWVQPFTIPHELPVADPAVEVFCGVLPEIEALGAEIVAALQALPEDDGEMTDEEWAAFADWESIGAELRALFEAAEELLTLGDETRPDALAPQWEIVTAPLRQARDALQAVDFDLSTESGRMIAAELRAGASEPDPEGDAATEALTDWFLDNCLDDPGEPFLEDVVPAAPVRVTPRFTG